MVKRIKPSVIRAVAKDLHPVQKLVWACALLMMVMARAPLGRVATQATSLAVQIAAETARAAALSGAVRERAALSAIDSRDAASKGSLAWGWPLACLPAFPEAISFVPRVSRLLPNPTRASAQEAPREPLASRPHARAPPSVAREALI